MKINIGNHEFTELWDGVLYKALSDYPNVSDNEMKDIIDFMNYEKINMAKSNVNQMDGDDENSMYGRYMDRINAVYIYEGTDTWTDESGVEWNKVEE